MNEQPQRETFFGACPHDCPDTCAMIYEVEDGKLVEVQGNKDHPMTRGTLCVKLKDFHDHHANPDRLKYPLRRIGPKGSKQFERITWDEAIAEIGRRWREIIATYGSQAIMPYSYLGNMGLVQGINSGDPFFNRLGTTVNEKTFCASGSSTAWLLDRRSDRRRRSGKLRAFQVHRHLGVQLDLDQSASLAVRARGAEARRQGGGHRQLPVAHGQGRRLAYLPAAGHRRRVGDGHHQFDHQPGAGRSRLCRSAHLRLRGAEGARGRVHARLCREDHRRQSLRHQASSPRSSPPRSRP